jgi:hypothetical protein
MTKSYRSFLKSLPSGSQIAVESVGNWNWLIEEMENDGHIPTLTNTDKAKLMMSDIIDPCISNRTRLYCNT